VNKVDKHGTQVSTRRTPEWKDVKRILEFKTFYLIIVVALLGLILILADRQMFAPDSKSSFRGVLLALGATLLTSSTVSIIYELFLKLDVVEFLSERVSAAQNTFPELVSLGPSRSSLDFAEICRSASHHLKIVGLNCNDVLSTPCVHIIAERLRAEPEFCVKVLIINPWSGIAIRRSASPPYKTRSQFLRQVWATYTSVLDSLPGLQESGVAGDRFEIRLYDEIPSLSMILGGSFAIIVPITFTRTGGASPYFRLQNSRAKESLYSIYEEHFDAIWKRTTAVSDFEADYQKTIENERNRLLLLPDSYDKWSATLAR
jgi:hypothetical protein